MPISGQSPLTNISSAKEQRLTFQPILFAEFTLGDGSVLRVADENFDQTDGGPTFLGESWLPRIKTQNLAQIQAVSDNGIVQSPSLELTLADADKEILIQWEIPDGKGLKGARLRVLFALWDADTSTFSEDYAVKFSGVCNAPSWDESTFTVSAINKLNLSRVMLPATRIGRTCPWVFPETVEQQLAAATDPSSPFYKCGYSPTFSAGNPGFTACDKSFAACIERMGNSGAATSATSPSSGVITDGTAVQIEKDRAGRPTGRFGGIQFDPPLDWRGVSYTSGTKGVGLDNPNLAKFNDFFPMIYGTCFVDPVVMNVVGNPNSTKLEVALCVGQIHDALNTPGPIQAVVVNDYVIPWRLDGSNSKFRDIQGWEWINNGGRNGHVNKDLGYDGRGDPYGNIAAIEIVVPIQVAASNSVPQVRVLTTGPKLRDASGAVMDAGNSALTAWVLRDLLNWGGLSDDELDLATFQNEAAYCSTGVSYTDLTGQLRTRARYHCGFAIRQRRPVGEIVRNVLAGCKGMLMPNLGFSSDTSAGKIQLFLKKTTAEQGGSKYTFDMSNVARKGDRTTPLAFKIDQRPISDTPNKISVSFQDEDYYYNSDGLEIDDSGDINRVGQEIAGGTQIEGVNNWDQAKRALQTMFFEQYRGNPRTGEIDPSGPNGSPTNDSGGTWIADFDVSFRGIDRRIGEIITIGDDLLHVGYDQEFRILGIKATANFERITIRASWHEDDPYTDGYGQNPTPLLEAALRNYRLRPPFGWLPNYQAPMDGDVLFDSTEKTYGLAQLYETAADGTSIAKLQWSGYLPVNHFSSLAPPFAPQAGGTGTYWLALCGVDENGLLTAPSSPIAQGGNNLPNIHWPGTNYAGWKLYAGTSPNKLSKQAEGSGTPSSVSFSTFLKASEAMPDVMFDHLVLRVKLIYHSGVFGAQVNNIPSSNVIEIDGFTFSDDEWAGRTVSILGQPNTSGIMPIWDFLIASNDAISITLADTTAGPVDLNALGIKVGDALVVRTRPDIISDTTIGDSKFINEVDYFDAPITITDASNTTPIVITLATPTTEFFDDAEVLVANVVGNDAANGKFFVSVPTSGDPQYDSTHLILKDSAGSGDYLSGGNVRLITHGFRPHQEIGRILRIIAGSGAGQKRVIVENNETTLTLDRSWSSTHTTIDLTTVFIIEDAAWLSEYRSNSNPNSDPATLWQGTTNIDNWLDRTLWTQAFTASKDLNGQAGKESVEIDSPGREIYVFGGPGNSNAQYERSGFEIEDSTEGVNVAPIMPVRKSGDAVDFIVQVKTAFESDCYFNIWLCNTVTGVKESIFAANHFKIPANVTGRWPQDSLGNPAPLTDFMNMPEHFDQRTDYFSIDIGSSDGIGQFTTALKWRLTPGPGGAIGGDSSTGAPMPVL